MLAIRLQRTGRKGHAQFRVVVQESRVTPTSGRVVASLGHYDPHTKTTVIEKEKATLFLSNGAQPSERVARLLQSEGVELPKWVKLSENKKRSTRHPEKLRRNQPAKEVVAEVSPVEVESVEVAAQEPEVVVEETKVETPSE